jgi:hypothetical protein
MASKSGKSWSDVFSVKNIKQLIKDKHKCIIDPYDFIDTRFISMPLSTKSLHKPLSPILTKVNKKLKMSRNNSLYKFKSSISKPGIGEVQFQKVNRMCNYFRQNIKKILKNCELKNKKLRAGFKKCESEVNLAYEKGISGEVPEEFWSYTSKLKAQRSHKNKLLMRLNNMYSIQLEFVLAFQ